MPVWGHLNRMGRPIPLSIPLQRSLKLSICTQESHQLKRQIEIAPPVGDDRPGAKHLVPRCTRRISVRMETTERNQVTRTNFNTFAEAGALSCLDCSASTLRRAANICSIVRCCSALNVFVMAASWPMAKLKRNNGCPLPKFRTRNNTGFSGNPCLRPNG
jgi:hypothetical protein